MPIKAYETKPDLNMVEAFYLGAFYSLRNGGQADLLSFAVLNSMDKDEVEDLIWLLNRLTGYTNERQAARKKHKPKKR